jgi:hypothetical protein
MRKLLLSVALPLISAAAHGQFQYIVTTQTAQSYSALPTSSPSVNGAQGWDDEKYKVPLPFSFKWNGTQTLNSIGVLTDAPGIADDTVAGPRNFFSAGFVDLVDKSIVNSAGSISPIRYQTTGTTPNRIFKLEFRNAGFFDEYDPASSGPLKDSVSFQYWLYETSNIIEIRYGQSHITAGSSYFPFGAGPTVGFVQGGDINNGTITEAYFLTGNSNTPSVDSTTNVFSLGALNNYPASGTVYRFTPKGSGAPSTSVGSTTLENTVSVYPTMTGGSLHVNHKGTEQLRYSIVSENGSPIPVSGSIDNGVQTIDVSGLPSGPYLLRIEGASAQSAYRFIKL